MPDIPSRQDVIKRHIANGGDIAAALPVHYPRALFRAFDILPVEVWGPPGRDTTLGDAHLQAYTCSIVRSGLAFALSGGLEVADYLVIPHTCDSLQGLASLLLDFIPPGRPVLPLYIPKESSETSRRFFASEIQVLYERLAELTGRRPTGAALMEAVRREERADLLLGDLLDARARLPLGDREFYAVARSREYLPAEEFADVATATLELAGDKESDAVKVIMSGMVPEPLAVLDVITEAGGMVVGDDLACTGRRRYPVVKIPDPMERMAANLLSAPPDPARGCPVSDRVRHFLALRDQFGADGVVFFTTKFCEPEQYYLPQLRNALDDAGLPSIGVEVDISEELSHQTVTRIEALLEMIR